MHVNEIGVDHTGNVWVFVCDTRIAFQLMSGAVDRVQVADTIVPGAEESNWNHVAPHLSPASRKVLIRFS